MTESAGEKDDVPPPTDHDAPPPPEPDGAAADASRPDGEADKLEEPRALEHEPPEPAVSSEAIASAPTSPSPPTEEVEPRPAAPPVDNGRPGTLVPALIGAVVGAVVAIVAIFGFSLVNAPDAALPGRVQSQDDAIKALASRVDALQLTAKKGPDEQSALVARVAALEAGALKIKGLDEEAKAAIEAARAARADAAKALTLASQSRPVDVAVAPAPPAPPPPPPFNPAPLEARISALEAALAAPKSASRAPPEEGVASKESPALAVVAEALADNLRNGRPFPLEESALERLGVAEAKLAPLKPLAEHGAPTPASLAADFRAVAPAVLASVAAAPKEGVMDRLMANMSKVVKVTPVGEIAGDDPAALVSQIEGALDHGDVARAISAWDRLPDPARQASKDWALAARTRQAAQAAAQSLVAEAMAALAKTKN
jgi:hypothetical protein